MTVTAVCNNCGCPLGGVAWRSNVVADSYATDVAERDAKIARLSLRVAQLTSGSEAANLAGRVVERDAEIARLRAALAAHDAGEKKEGGGT